MIRLATTAVCTALIGAFATALPASAAVTCGAPSGSVDASDISADATIECPAVPPVSRPGDSGKKARKSGTGAKPACVWVPKPDYQAGAGQPVEGKGGHWYQKFCSFGDYETLADFQRALGDFDSMNTHQTNLLQRAGLEVRFFATPPTAPRRTPEQAMELVAEGIAFPETVLAVNPAPAKQVVGFPTWVWLTGEHGRFDPNRYRAQAKQITLQDGYSLTWQIVPRLTLDSGTGESQTCSDAGVPWSASTADNPDACTVTYDQTGTYTLTANVGWTVRWWLAGQAQRDIPGPTKTATQALTVGEIQAVTR